jgi:hypothetical protein
LGIQVIAIDGKGTFLSSTSAVCRQPARELRRQFDNTGGLKTPCIGRWMSPMLTMIVGFVLFMPPTTKALVRRFALNALNP